jgi:acetoin utilization protein AcuB
MKLNDSVLTIMTSDVISLTPSKTLLDVKHIFEKKTFHHHIPIISNKKLVGMVSLIDFMRKIGTASLDDNDPVYKIEINEIMTLDPIKIYASKKIKDAIEMLLKQNVHALVVTDDENRVIGMLSTKDILQNVLLMTN